MFWRDYYWFVNAYLVIVCLLIGFFGVKTPKEKIMICFILLLRVLLLLYYVVCLIWVHDMSSLEGTLAFWISVAVAGFLSINFRKRYMYGN